MHNTTLTLIFKLQTLIMPKFILYINAVSPLSLADSDVECFLLETSLPEEFITQFAARAAGQNKIVLLNGEKSAALSARLKLDGAVIDVSSSENPVRDFEHQRKLCAKGAVVGAISRNRRHEAMLLSECEPDFVIFKIWSAGDEGTRRLVKWYNDLFLIQSAVFCQEDSVNVEGYETDIVILNENLYKIFVAKKARLD